MDRPRESRANVKIFPLSVLLSDGFDKSKGYTAKFKFELPFWQPFENNHHFEMPAEKLMASFVHVEICDSRMVSLKSLCKTFAVSQLPKGQANHTLLSELLRPYQEPQTQEQFEMTVPMDVNHPS